MINKDKDNIYDMINSKISHYKLYSHLGSKGDKQFIEFVKSLRKGSFSLNLKIYMKYKFKWLYHLILRFKY